MKVLETCEHRCQAFCHPGKDCPTTPCEAEMRHYCKCRNRYVLTVCKSILDRQPLECNADCWKQQRDARLANAFSSKAGFEESKGSIEMEYYPEDTLAFAEQYPKFAVKVEGLLAAVVL